MLKRSSCVAHGCRYDREGIYRNSKAWRTFHQFPADDYTQFLKWVQASGNINLLKKLPKTIRDTLALCSAHFVITTRRLQSTTVPTIFQHAGPIPDELMIDYAAKHGLENYFESLIKEVVPPISATSDHTYYISDVGEFGRVSGEDHPNSASKSASKIAEDSILFIKANNGSDPGNPDEASTLQEELQTMESHEVSNWLQLSEDVDCAEILSVPNQETETASKWKHCKKYLRKRNLNNQADPIDRHLEFLKKKRDLTVHPSYITLQSQSAEAESADPMSRLLTVDKSRSLMTQEYVSSVLSALDTDLSYSVFDEEKNSKAADVTITCPLSPRQRESDSPAPTLSRKTRTKGGKSLLLSAPSPVVNPPTISPVLPGPVQPGVARFQIVAQRLTSPPPLVPFQQSSLLRLNAPLMSVPGLRLSGVSSPGQRLQNPGTRITGLRIGNMTVPMPEMRLEGTTFSGLRIENPRTVAEPQSQSPVAEQQSETPVAEQPDDIAAVMEIEGFSDEVWPKLPKNLCRVCAKTCAVLESVFSEEGTALNLVELVHSHLPIMVTPGDLLPTQICLSCIDRLQAADSLVRTCVDADTALRKLLNAAQNAPPQVVEIFEEGDQSYGFPDDDHGPQDGDHGHEDSIFSQDDDVTVKPKAVKRNTNKNPDLSNLLSADDVTLINKMKGDGLKVTLVRVPNLNDLTEEKKHQRVMQVLRTMNSTKPTKKPLSTFSVKADATNRETANISPVDSVLQGLTAGSALRDTATLNISVPEHPREAESSTPEPPADVPAEAVAVAEPVSEPVSEPLFAPSPTAKPKSLLKNDLLDGISLAIKQGHVAKTGSIIKLKCKPDNSSSVPSSVYVYVRNKDIAFDPYQLPRKILDLDILHEHQQRQNQLKEKRAAARAAKHQASLNRRKARVREKRRAVKERRFLTCEECGAAFDTKEEVADHRMEHLKCKYCDKQFSKKPSLVEHERVHTKEKPFICEQCGRAFRTRAQMSQHAQRHNTETPYRCQLCGQEFAVRNTYQAHVNRHSSDAPYLCEVCGKCFKVQVALRLHRLTHRSFNCNICNKVFSYRAYQIHKKSHAGDESKFPCTYCNKKFLTVHRLKIHMLIHEATYPFSCSVCRRSFKRMTHLQAHQARHSSDQLQDIAFFCCAICQVQYEQPSQLSQHVKTHTDEERQSLRSYKCDTCNKCFSIERELRAHELRHAGKQTFSCGTCDKAFDTKKEFDEHSDEHTEDKPFACEICGKRFRALVNLNNHQQIHLTFKPYPCQSCPKAFKTINGLNQHKVVHSDVRKHTCSICNVGFKRRDAMKNHERTHFAERPYACSVCGRAFKVKADCSTHLKRHREAGIEGSILESCYSCPVCSASFNLKVELTTHVTNAHQLEVAVLSKDDDLVLVPEVEIF